jgi:hypothetical protein
MLIGIRIWPELVALVDEQAETEGRTRSAVIRRLVAERLGWEKPRRGKTNLQVAPVRPQPVKPATVKPVPMSQPVLAGRPQCEGCRGPLRMMKGKLVCCRIGCSREGQAQGEA